MKISPIFTFGIVVFLAAVLMYVNTIPNEFAWDDRDFIFENPQITSLSNVPSFYVTESSHGLWRPLRETMYTLTYALWKLNPVGYHLNGIALHALITLLFYCITLRLSQKPMLALMTGALFAVHPIHTDRVTNMTAGFDLWGILFVLLAFYFFIRYRASMKIPYYGASILMLVPALLASEEAVVFVLLLLLFDFVYTYGWSLRKTVASWKSYVPFILITLLYVIAHIMIVGRVGRASHYFYNSFLATQLTSVKALALYVGYFFLPFKLTIHHELAATTSLLSIPLLISTIVLLALFVLVWASYKKNKIIFFSIAWFFITMLLFMNFLPKPTIFAERYAYLASFGFCLAVAYGLHQLTSQKKSKFLGFALILLIVIAFSARTYARNMDWRDEETLLVKTLETSPLSTSAHSDIGEFYKRAGDFEKAEEHLLRAAELSRNNFRARDELGTLYAEQQRYDLAEQYLIEAIDAYQEDDRGYYKGYNDLGVLYLRWGKTDDAIFMLKKAVAIRPDLAKAHHDMGLAYAQKGLLDEAEQELRAAIRINPDEPVYQNNLRILLEKRKSLNTIESP